MASIPTYIYLGDNRVNGILGSTEAEAAAGAEYLQNLIAGVAPGAGGWTTGLLNKELLSDVPNNSGSNASPQHSFRPWYDGNAGTQALVPTGSYGGLSITFPGVAWTADEHVGRRLFVDAHPDGVSSGIGGPSFGSFYTIASNTADTLTLQVGLSKEGIPGAQLSDNGQDILVHIGTGSWVRYQHVSHRAVGALQTDLTAGAGLLGTMGDCWYIPDIPGAWGPTVSLMQELDSDHGDLPGFRFVKRAQASGWRGMNGGGRLDADRCRVR